MEARDALFEDKDMIDCFVYDHGICNALFGDCDCNRCTERYEEYLNCGRNTRPDLDSCAPLDCENDVCFAERSAMATCLEVAPSSCFD